MDAKVKVTLLLEESRNGNCPAVLDVDGEITTDQGETITEGMVLLRSYTISQDTETLRQVELVHGEGVLAVTEDLLLAAADAIRARR